MVPTLHKIDDAHSVWAVWVKTDYDEAYLADMKKLIPPRYRRWDRERRAWLFKGVAVGAVCSLLRKHFDAYQWEKQQVTSWVF